MNKRGLFGDFIGLIEFCLAAYGAYMLYTTIKLLMS